MTTKHDPNRSFFLASEDGNAETLRCDAIVMTSEARMVRAQAAMLDAMSRVNAEAHAAAIRLLDACETHEAMRKALGETILASLNAATPAPLNADAILAHHKAQRATGSLYIMRNVRARIERWRNAVHNYRVAYDQRRDVRRWYIPNPPAQTIQTGGAENAAIAARVTF